MDNKSLLLVDDEANVLKSLCRELSPTGYSLFTAASAAEGGAAGYSSSSAPG